MLLKLPYPSNSFKESTHTSFNVDLDRKNSMSKIKLISYMIHIKKINQTNRNSTSSNGIVGVIRAYRVGSFNP